MTRKTDQKIPVSLPMTMTADRVTYIAFFFIFAMIPLFLIIVSALNHVLTLIDSVCFSMPILLQAIAAYRYRIDLHDDHIIYTTLLSGSINIPFAMIEKVQYGNMSNRMKPPFRLEITPIADSPYRPFYINLKIFKWEDLQVLMQVFEEKGYHLRHER